MANGKRTYDPEATKARLLKVAFETFQKDGYHAAALHDVMKRAKVTGGALYHHFPTKRDLGVAVIEGPVRAVIEECWIAPLSVAPTAFAGVRTALRNILNSMDERKPRGGCPLNNAAQELAITDKAFQLAISAILQDWRRALAQRISADSRAGRLPASIDADSVAEFIIAGSEGALGLTKAHQSVTPLRRFAEQLEVYMKALEAHPKA